MSGRLKIIFCVAIVSLVATLGSQRYLAWKKQESDAYARKLPELSDEEVHAFAPTTTRRVSSIKDVPEDVWKVFLDSRNRYREDLRDMRQRPSVPPEMLARVKKAADEFQIPDRSELWTGGCMADPHFLEAGEMKDGWWIFCEYGGIADNVGLTMVTQTADGPKITASFALYGQGK